MRSTVRPLRRTLLRLLPIATLAAAGIAFSAPASAADELVVSAAASLTNAFKAVGDAYEKQHPDTKVLFNFGASDVLMQQIAKGAPADVFASADQKAMDRAADEKVIVPGTRRDFAANSLVLIVPADSKAPAPKSLNDLTAPGVKRIAYGDPASVPVGRYTEGALRATGVWDAVSAKGVLAANVRQSLDYVARGEVDAGFVFGTDAAIMPGRVKIALTVPTKTAITYPIAVVRTAATPRRRSRSSTSSRRRRVRPCCRRSASSPRASERSAMQDAWVPLLLSLKVAGWATALDIVLGVAAAFMLARWRSPLRDVVDSVLTLPLVLPPTVLGYYLLVLLGRRGVFGAWLDKLGIELVFTWQGAVIASMVVAFPLILKSARAAFEGVDPHSNAPRARSGSAKSRCFSA